MGPHAGQAREQVLVLGQFHLSAGCGCLSAFGEYVEDEAGSVEDFDFQFFFDVSHLFGRQVIIEYGESDILAIYVIGNFL